MKSLWSKLCAVALTSICISCSKSVGDGSVEFDLLPVMLTEDGNWSMVDQNGNIVYEDEFKNMPSPAIEGIFSVKEGETYTLYKIGEKNPMALNGCEGIKNTGYMSGGVIPIVFPSERIQLRDKYGKKICDLEPFDGKEIVRCKAGFKEGLLAFCILDQDSDTKWGFMDRTGNVVIKPIYRYTYGFEDGVAVCSIDDESSHEKKDVVIDHDGKILFEIDTDLYVVGSGFQNGRMLLVGTDESVLYIVDKRGEKTKLPSKFDNLYDFNGKYIIFKSNDEEYGVANVNGDICIRPKYSHISFGIGDLFLAQKTGKDETLVLNTNGEIVSELDYKYLLRIHNFGYRATERKRCILLGKDLEPKGTEDFYKFGDTYLDMDVQSDYFNPEDVAIQFTKRFRVDGFDKYTYGESAADIFVDRDASGYAAGLQVMDVNSNGPHVLDTNISKLNYNIIGHGYFTERLSKWENGGYQWNNESQLYAMRLIINVPKNSIAEVFDKLVDILKTQGYKETESYNAQDGSSKLVGLTAVGEAKSGQQYNSMIAVCYEKGVVFIDMAGQETINNNIVDDNLVAEDSISH